MSWGAPQHEGRSVQAHRESGARERESVSREEGEQREKTNHFTKDFRGHKPRLIWILGQEQRLHGLDQRRAARCLEGRRGVRGLARVFVEVDGRSILPRRDAHPLLFRGIMVLLLVDGGNQLARPVTGTRWTGVSSMRVTAT